MKIEWAPGGPEITPWGVKRKVLAFREGVCLYSIDFNISGSYPDLLNLFQKLSPLTKEDIMQLLSVCGEVDKEVRSVFLTALEQWQEK